LIVPALPPVHAGQRLGSLPFYAAMTSPSNFRSRTGSITEVSASLTGTVSDANEELAEGQLVGFEVVVRDTGGNVAVFTTITRSVEYAARVSSTAGNEAIIEINPIVADDWPVSVTIAGGRYSGTYASIPAGALKPGAPPWYFAGTAKVEADGAPSSLTVGSILTHDPGLWAVSTGSLALDLQATWNGQPIPNATGETFVLGGGEIGGTYRLRITAGDGVRTTMIETDGLTIPRPALSVSFLSERTAETGKSGALLTFASLDFGDAEVGAELRLIVFAESSPGPILSAALGGVPLERLGSESGNNLRLAMFRAQRPVASTVSLVVTLSGGAGYSQGALALYRVSNAPSRELSSGASVTGGDTFSIALNTSAGGAVIGGFVEDRSSGGISVVGLENQRVLIPSGDPNATFRHGFLLPSVSASPLAITAILTGPGTAAGLASSLEA
jgi:hypothetical protein